VVIPSPASKSFLNYPLCLPSPVDLPSMVNFWFAYSRRLWRRNTPMWTCSHSFGFSPPFIRTIFRCVVWPVVPPQVYLLAVSVSFCGNPGVFFLGFSEDSTGPVSNQLLSITPCNGPPPANFPGFLVSIPLQLIFFSFGNFSRAPNSVFCGPFLPSLSPIALCYLHCFAVFFFFF